MKVYREKLNYTTDSGRIIRDMERLDVIKSIGVRRNYALIVNELSICQSGVERIRKNTIKWGGLTLFRIPSIMEVYAIQPHSALSSIIYKSECSSCWNVLVVYFTGLPPREEYTLIGEI